jgi:flagellar biosynthetic protein FlhB
MSDKGDRTEAPTPKRKKQARDDGRIARSPDVAAWAGVLVATFVLPGALARIGRTLVEGLRSVQDLPNQPEPVDAVHAFSAVARGALAGLLPLLVTFAAVALVSALAQVGFVLTGAPLKPKLNRLNPLQGFKRLVSVKALWEAGKSVLKLAVVGLVAMKTVKGIVAGLVAAGPTDLGLALPQLADDALGHVRTCAMLGLLIAVADYAWQRRQLGRELRMTKQEIRDEARNAEGDPHVKARLRAMRLGFSRNRMIADVADADVVLVNPTHVAVAIRYNRAVGVPQIVARGAGSIAARIREAAADNGVPLVEHKPLARALYGACEVGDAIPRELFEAVAKVLAFVYALGARARSSRAEPVRLPGVVANLSWEAPPRRTKRRRGRGARRSVRVPQPQVRNEAP